MPMMRYSFLFALMFSSSVAVHAQLQSGSRQDSTAQAKVLELIETERVLSYYDEDINTPGDFIYSSQVSTIIKQKPGKTFPQYWVQVIDHRRYDGIDIPLHFYVDPQSWEIFYLDTKTNLLWTWDNWKKQSRYRRS
ncbi:MAG: hypothetical protein JWQ38_2765 [Flavipsychrobacter sp.]|nr:hypothetical protein [Flavipsychrobacter sp.]